MSQTVPIDRPPPAGDLLKILRTWTSQSQDQNTLLLVSLGALATEEAEQSFWIDLRRIVSAFRIRHHARAFEMTPVDYGFLVKMGEFNQVMLMTDAKVELLRLVQQHFPEQFGMIDQSRLIRPIDLRFKLANAIRLLERYEQEDEKPKPAMAKTFRRLGEQDIDRVLDVNKQIGNVAFSKVFIRHQNIAEIAPGAPPVNVMHEYFIGMDALKKHVFLDVELRGSGNIFNQLTITLDRLLLDAYRDVNPGRASCSINLNVESVFTRAFETFLGDAREDAFSNIAFEFRQANILQQFDEYEVAASLISSRGGMIAVDAVFPETVGIVNMDRLHANMAKIFWRQGAEQVLPQYRAEIERMQSAGTRVVLARVDDDLGIDVGHDLGITMFQGFHIDDLIKQKKTG